MHKQGENYEEAAYWFGEAAKEGDVTSLLEFGKLYRDGLGVDQDFETAEQMLTLALENGDKEAEAELAKLKQMRGK
jgi:TPR repeat protein